MVWIGVSTIVMGVINVFRDAVTYVKEMDKALTDLSKVVNFSTEELDGMKDSAIELGRELGKSGVEIMKAFAEFGRLRKVKEEIVELSKSAILFSNVTELTADSAAKAINTTMLAFKMNIDEATGIVDKFNQLQNNYRISATDLADSIGIVGVAAQQAGLKIDELNGYVTAIAGATGLSGLI